MGTDPYREVHKQLAREFGKAASRACVSCGGPARHWAYQYNSDRELQNERGQYYSEDLLCYAPMCIGCHVRYDLEHDPQLLERRRNVGKRRGDLNAARLKSDPEYAARMKRLNTDVARALAERAKKDDVYAEVMVKARGKALESIMKKRSEDLEYLERLRAGASRAARSRRRCAECDVVTNPGNLGRHQKGTGHMGWAAV